MKNNSNWNLPNTLTIARILLVPFCVYALFKNHDSSESWKWLAWWGYFIVGATDFIDGRLARARGSITSLGTFLDPVADKVAIGSALISLSILHKIWWWVTVLILFRELAVTLLRVAVIKDGVIPASKGGKLKTLMQSFGISFYVMPLYSWLIIPRDIFMTAAIALTVITGIDYFYKAYRRF
jgi:CDP-diacylglycerol--glycerol-3-phosphate 3-phosphatidyltransferase